MPPLSLLAVVMLLGDPTPPAPHGYLNQPARSIDRVVRLPLERYDPQPGDVLIYSDPTPFWDFMYALAFTGAPGHSGLVIQLDDGQMGVLEAGYNDKPWVRVVPLVRRLEGYRGAIWARRRKEPITAEQSRTLTAFAQTIDGNRYGVFRLLCQMTPFRSRGPLRTFVIGKPRGVRDTYICSEAVLEALVAAGLADAETTRPCATYPRDLFFDQSPNPFINAHPPLAAGWEKPALWISSDACLKLRSRLP
jgi:hypothetical protein